MQNTTRPFQGHINIAAGLAHQFDVHGKDSWVHAAVFDVVGNVHPDMLTLRMLESFLQHSSGDR